MNARLILVLLLCLPAAYAHAEEPERRGGYIGIGLGYYTAPLEVRGFVDPAVPGGEIKHTYFGVAPVITLGHRSRYVRFYSEFSNGIIDPKTEKGGSSVLAGYALLSANIDAILPVGRAGHLFAGFGIGVLNFETFVKEPGAKTVLDHTDLSTPVHAGYFHDLGRMSVEAGVSYVMADEEQESGRYEMQSFHVVGGYLGASYSF